MFVCTYIHDVGPHLPNTGKAKAFEITKNSAAYWPRRSFLRIVDGAQLG